MVYIVVAPLQVAAPPSGAPLQGRRVLLLVVGTSAFTAAAGGQRRRPPIPVTNPPRHPPLPVEEGKIQLKFQVSDFS